MIRKDSIYPFTIQTIVMRLSEKELPIISERLAKITFTDSLVAIYEFKKQYKIN